MNLAVCQKFILFCCYEGTNDTRIIRAFVPALSCFGGVAFSYLEDNTSVTTPKTLRAFLTEKNLCACLVKKKQQKRKPEGGARTRIASFKPKPCLSVLHYKICTSLCLRPAKPSRMSTL